MSFPDWGSVPAWLTAGSLLLAFRIFLRDRATNDRAQVERVGVWWEVNRDPSLPGTARIDEVKIKTFIGNGSDLPIEATQITWHVRTRWMVPDLSQPHLPTDHPQYPGVWSFEDGTPDSGRFTGPVSVAPQTTWDSDWQSVNVGHTAPDDAVQLVMLGDGVRRLLAAR